MLGQAASLSLLMAETAAEPEHAAQTEGDIWLDQATMEYLKLQEHGPDTSAAERRRVERGASQYVMSEEALYRRMPDGTTRRVPPPGERADLIRRTHQRCGHWGERRTAAACWPPTSGGGAWSRRRGQQCEPAPPAATSSHPSTPGSQCCSRQGLFYRWGADLFGPLPASARGHTYAMVCVEYCSKHIECIPLPDKTAANTAAAFLAACTVQVWWHGRGGH